MTGISEQCGCKEALCSGNEHASKMSEEGNAVPMQPVWNSLVGLAHLARTLDNARLGHIYGLGTVDRLNVPIFCQASKSSCKKLPCMEFCGCHGHLASMTMVQDRHSVKLASCALGNSSTIHHAITDIFLILSY